MAKNEIHARVSPESMTALKQICSDRGCNLSDVTRAALVLYVDAYNCAQRFERHKLALSENSLEIALIGISLEATQITPDLLDELDVNVFDATNNNLPCKQVKDYSLQVIEQELNVFFARCRDEYDPPDGELYWFWFDSGSISSWCFDPDTDRNWCPGKRFNSLELAIKDCLNHRLNGVVESCLPTLNCDTTEETSEVIDW